jgi:hypothetical protein
MEYHNTPKKKGPKAFFYEHLLYPQFVQVLHPSELTNEIDPQEGQMSLLFTPAGMAGVYGTVTS